MTDIFYTLLRLQGDQDWHPPINMHESEDEFWIEVELPGLEKEHIKVVYENNILSISGIRTRSSMAPKYICCQLELEYGAFYRFIRFDTPVIAEKIEAKYERGILDIHVPKKIGVEEDLYFDEEE